MLVLSRRPRLPTAQRRLRAQNGPDRLQQPVLNRAAAASERNAFGFARVGEPGLENANAHIQVAVAKTTTGVDTLEDAAARRQANARL